MKQTSYNGLLIKYETKCENKLKVVKASGAKSENVAGAVWPEYLKTSHFENFSAILASFSYLQSTNSFFQAANPVISIYIWLNQALKKIIRAAWPEYLKICHFEHFAAIFNAFRLFTAKLKILASSRLLHIILHMVRYQNSYAKSEKLLE